MTTKYLEKITFEEIINQALEIKEDIAETFLKDIKDYGEDYPYYTLIANLHQKSKPKTYYISFSVDSEIENCHINEFNLKLMTIGRHEYQKESWTKDSIIKFLEEKLTELKEMTI